MTEGLGDGDEPEFQIAPMIDVLLVLLIFFMSITTIQVVRVDRNIVLPVATMCAGIPPRAKRPTVLSNMSTRNST